MNVIIQKRTLPLANVMASAHYQNCLILKVTTKAALVKYARKGGKQNLIMQSGQKSTFIPNFNNCIIVKTKLN